jgi:hypothetical protein
MKKPHEIPHLLLPMTGLDHLARLQSAEAIAHDKAVATLSQETLLAAAKDLGQRRAHDRKDPEQRWVMARKAALLRRLSR